MVAVHCHAGLGRTGFVICSYLVYEHRMTAHESVHYIRAKRPGSVQMSKQIEIVEELERFIISKRRVFTECADVTETLSFEVHLKNQQVFLHGRDALIFRHIPRIIFVCCARLVELCTGYIIDTILVTVNQRYGTKPLFVKENLKILTDLEKATWLDFVPSFLYERERLSNDNFVSAHDVINGLILSTAEHLLPSDQKQKIQNWKHRINKTNNGIDEIFEEKDPTIIGAIMWSWLRSLKIQCGAIEILAKMYAFLRPFAGEKEAILLLFVVIHILTQLSLPNDPILHKLTSNKKLHDYLISKQADHSNKNLKTVLKYKTSLSVDLLQRISIFFQKTADQFEHLSNNNLST
ncbi:unnamed protein product [Didymodactylos carnosus]|uniref:Tyrosine specific protein phosphatases domain-containing protein n=1 Tax=Didymodactylos carnosus TaxID=1234261 RepID=A0A815Y0L9_9BILA|nr:unnamed protein product [Didymodactylos carnosus]CAF4426041.1 unnamed protein product [Didymodactylos carnosus]